MIFGGGNNNTPRLGIPSDAESNNKYVSRLTEIPGVNALDILCIAPGWLHTVIVMRDGSVLAAGKASVADGSGDDKNYEVFTKISICSEEIKWAAAGKTYSLYLTKSRRVILCHKSFGREKIEIQLPKPALSVFGGKFYGGIIDEDGCAYFLDRDDPRKAPARHEFPSPAVDLVCCDAFKAVLLSDHRVFGNGSLNNGQCDFTLVPSLSNYKITSISGYAFSMLAIGYDGLVLAYGKNSNGEFGNGTKDENYREFQLINIPNNVKAKHIACSAHSFIITKDGDLYGCGWNKYNQLFQGTEAENVLTFTKINIMPKFTGVFVGDVHSLAISGYKVPENPAKAMFSNSTLNILLSMFDKQDQTNSDLENQSIELKCQLTQQSDKLMKSLDEKDQKISQLEDNVTDLRNQIQQLNEKLTASLEEKDQKISQLESQIAKLNDHVQQQIVLLLNSIADRGLEMANK